MVYSLYRKQFLPISQQEAWEFFSSPINLKTITPDYMGFEVTSDLGDGKMYAGQIITYKVKPVLGIPISWVTEITHSQEPNYFVDEQRFGPYSLWHHKHYIKPVEGGVEMEDLVHYKVPFGFLGKLACYLFVNQRLKSIFDYRYKKLEELFNKKT